MADELDWDDGDYTRTAATLEPVAPVVLDAAGVTAGDRVLDAACGTGNAALAAARRGARAVGVDAAEGLVAIAGRRAAAVDGDVRFIVAISAPPGDPPRWGDAAWASELVARHGASEVAVTEQALAFTVDSPGAWFAEHEEHHPVWRWCRRQLAEARWDTLRDESGALLADANEDPGAFRTTSRYLVITAVR